MYRFFSNNKDFILSKEDEHHLINVCRINIGEKIEIVNVNKEVTIFEINHVKPLKMSAISSYVDKNGLPKDVTLLFALAKGDKQEIVIQKCTEIGVSKIVLVPSERSVMKISKDNVEKKLNRYQSIAKEASQQSHRSFVPTIEILSSFDDVKKHLSDVNFVGYEKLAGNASPDFEEIKKENVKSISIYIGSEGGISDKEIDYLNDIGFKNASLGNTILRCETAAIYCLSVISYLLEHE